MLAVAEADVFLLGVDVAVADVDVLAEVGVVDEREVVVVRLVGPEVLHAEEVLVDPDVGAERLQGSDELVRAHAEVEQVADAGVDVHVQVAPLFRRHARVQMPRALLVPDALQVGIVVEPVVALAVVVAAF